jgi:cytoskeletal protein CcmA (bactofilin family)
MEGFSDGHYSVRQGPGNGNRLSSPRERCSRRDRRGAGRSDTVRIDGRFRGEITSENTLIVGESGEIEATISSNTVAISGTVIGDVVAKRKVVLHKTAVVDGNVEAPSLVVEEGATINGQLKMPSPDGKKSDSGRLKAVSGGSDAGKDERPEA